MFRLNNYAGLREDVPRAESLSGFSNSRVSERAHLVLPGAYVVVPLEKTPPKRCFFFLK